MKERVINAVFAEMVEDLNLFEDKELRKDFMDIVEGFLVGGEENPAVDLMCEYCYKLQERAFRIGFETALKTVVEL